MLAIRRILCPTDFSEFAKGALEQAIVLGRRYQAEIVSLSVIPILPPTGKGSIPLPPPIEAQARQGLLDDLGRFAEPSRAAGLKTRVEVREGIIESVIVELAQSLPADLIVMGTHGVKGFERLMLGSVTERVLRRASCPVLTVPRRAHEAGHTADAVFKSIVCPVDFAEPSDRALRVAASLARENRARLLLLHVSQGLAEAGVPELVPEYRLVLEKQASERLQALFSSEERSACAVEDVLASGKPYVEILRLAEQRGCDLIVMGTHGSALGSVLFGSTAQAVVRGALCPVITVRS
jgi:nucleotide-binding universal stress UspA family protein